MFQASALSLDDTGLSTGQYTLKVVCAVGCAVCCVLCAVCCAVRWVSCVLCAVCVLCACVACLVLCAVHGILHFRNGLGFSFQAEFVDYMSKMAKLSSLTRAVELAGCCFRLFVLTRSASVRSSSQFVGSVLFVCLFLFAPRKWRHLFVATFCCFRRLHVKDGQAGLVD